MGTLTVQDQFLLIRMDAVLDLPHGGQNILPVLIRCQCPKSLRCREFQVHAHTVCQVSHPLHQLRICPGNRLHMDIAIKMVVIPKQPNGSV